MSASVIYEVQPKEVDADGNELELTQYTIQSTSTVKIKEELALASTTGVVYTDLTNYTLHTVAELQSDQPVNFQVLTSTGGTVVTITAVNNFILHSSTGQTYTYKILNTSGITANIVWRLYV